MTPNEYIENCEHARKAISLHRAVTRGKAGKINSPITEEDVIDLFTNIFHFHLSPGGASVDVLKAFSTARHHFEAEQMGMR